MMIASRELARNNPLKRCLCLVLFIVKIVKEKVVERISRVM